jgi:pimeloyl-ACP methyl ester carboxylesterase
VFHADVNGISIAYERAGEGPAIVLLHGFSHDSRVWRPQIEALSSDFTVIAWDAPGAGLSADPPESFGIADWANCLAGLLSSTAIERAHVIGLSWGGLLAQEFYRRYSDRVLSLVLADTYAGWKGSLPDPMPQERLAACLEDSALPPGEFVPRYVPGMFSPSVPPQTRDELSAIMSDFHPLGFRLMAKALAGEDTRDLLPRIQVPTLLIWGDADVRSPLHVAQQLHAAIAGSQLAIISGAGHVSNLEAPGQFTTLVRTFCRRARL